MEAHLSWGLHRRPHPSSPSSDPEPAYPGPPTTPPSCQAALVWTFAFPLVVGYHATFLVNSASHVWGSRPYETGECHMRARACAPCRQRPPGAAAGGSVPAPPASSRRPLPPLACRPARSPLPPTPNRPYPTPPPNPQGDLSTNNALVAFLAFGEGWHNNHHAFGYSARHGLEAWEPDPTWWLICALQAVGLAWDVQVGPLTCHLCLGQHSLRACARRPPPPASAAAPCPNPAPLTPQTACPPHPLQVPSEKAKALKRRKPAGAAPAAAVDGDGPAPEGKGAAAGGKGAPRARRQAGKSALA
jgi:hypothetical protein